MDNQNTEQLTKLREAILAQAIPLLDSDSVPPEDRFQLSMQMAEMQGTPEALARAFKVATQLNDTDKMGALLRLLGEVDYALQLNTPGETTEESASEE